MNYCVIPANTYGSIQSGDFNDIQFLTGGQASCTVIVVKLPDQSTAMAHILSANLNGAGGNPIAPAVCAERLAGFWDNYLAVSNKGNVQFIKGAQPGDSTDIAIQAVKDALEDADRPGEFNDVQNEGNPEYAVAGDGNIITDGIPTWAQAKNALLGLTDNAAVQGNINVAMFVGMNGNTLHANTELVVGINNVPINVG
ncbi:hypothetical protein PUV47_05695 [Pseudovibrio exalbescens]|uniref:hypothetical protein n=1 Tax=Pseudovibrio exalbescens TaxID=197461 RepID=UPI00236631AB|nr:hypothetical protein [Pseudovibrio exalbescens]MDD7909401.1 hypothetical protein [Pseudovibrio exalbescens]